MTLLRVEHYPLLYRWPCIDKVKIPMTLLRVEHPVLERHAVFSAVGEDSDDSVKS